MRWHFSGQRWEWSDGCVTLSYKIQFQAKSWETRTRWHNLGTTAKQAALVWAHVAKRRQWLHEEIYGVWSGGCQTILLLLHPFSGTTQVSQYQKGKTNLDLLEQEIVSGSDISWDICKCTSPQTDNHASILPLSFLQARCPSCRPTNGVKAPKACVPY